MKRDHMTSEPNEAQAEFLRRMERLIATDKDARLARLVATWSQDLRDRIEQGKAVADVSITRHAPDGCIHIEWRDNNSLFREGDVLCLHRGKQREQPSCMAVLEYEEDNGAVLNPLPDSFINPSEPRDDWVLDFGDFDLTRYYTEMLDRVATSDNARNNILPLLMNQVKPTQIGELRKKSRGDCGNVGIELGPGRGVCFRIRRDALSSDTRPSRHRQTAERFHHPRQNQADSSFRPSIFACRRALRR